MKQTKEEINNGTLTQQLQGVPWVLYKNKQDPYRLHMLMLLKMLIIMHMHTHTGTDKHIHWGGEGGGR